MKNNFKEFLEDSDNQTLIEQLPEEVKNILLKAKEETERIIKLKKDHDDNTG